MVGDAISAPAGNGAAPELVVGSLDGHLLVYAVDPLTDDLGTVPIYQQRVEGAVGAYNSIVIADLDSVAGNEVYVGCSLGLRRCAQ